MSKKLTFEQAAQVMRAAKLEPIDEYPGRTKPWKCKCLDCGETVFPSLGAVRTNGGGCRDCGLKKSANSRRMDSTEAIKIMKANGLIPLEPYTNSGKAWLCRCAKCGREVKPSLTNVKQGHSGCAYCAKRKVHPSDAEKLVKSKGLTPLVPFPGANRKWRCRHEKCGQIVYPAYGWILSGQGGCKRCGYEENKQKQLGDGEKAKEFLLSKGFKPLEPYPGSARPWKSKCLNCGFIVHPYYGRVKAGSGCGVCSKRIVVPEEAEKVMLRAKLKPLSKFPGSKQKWLCTCMKCGRKVTPSYGDVLQGYGGCKFCGGHYIEPEAAIRLMESKGLIPQTPYKNSGEKWLCKCLKCGRQVSPSYNQIQQGQSGCAYCARRRVDPKEAENIMLKSGAIPLTKYPGARRPWKSKCKKCDLTIFPIYSYVANNAVNPCGYCAGKKVEPGRAFQLMLSAGLTPLEDYQRADARWRCKCNKCGRVVTPTYSAIRTGQGGCKYCTNKGLDYTASAFLYLMTHSTYGAHKIGVGNHKTRNNRVDEHKKNGWKLFALMDFASGEQAYEAEQLLITWLRLQKGLMPYLSKREMPQGGETETVNSEEISLEVIWKKVQAIVNLGKRKIVP